MKSGEQCGYCQTILDTHCQMHGGDFCDLQTQYLTDTNMTVDDVYDRLYQIATPQQLAEARPVVEKQVNSGDGPPTGWVTQWRNHQWMKASASS